MLFCLILKFARVQKKFQALIFSKKEREKNDIPAFSRRFGGKGTELM